MKPLVIVAIIINSFICHSQAFEHDWSVAIEQDPVIGGNLSAYTIMDDLGNIYVAGSFLTPLNIDPNNSPSGLLTPTNPGFTDLYYAKYDPSGNLIWHVVIGGSGSKSAIAFEMDNDGNFVLTGWFADEIDFNIFTPGVDYVCAPSTDRNAFILKFNSAGSTFWHKQFESDNWSVIHDIDFDINNDYVLACRIKGTADADFNAGTAIHTHSDASCLIKLSQNGQYIWSKSVDKSMGHRVTVDTANNYYFSGLVGPNIDFDPGPGVDTVNNVSQAYTQRIYISKFDENGNYIWTRTMNDYGQWYNNSFRANDMQADNLGNIYLVGFFENTFDFDLNGNSYDRTSQGEEDFFLIKINSQGQVVYLETGGGTTENTLTLIKINKANQVFLQGAFTGYANINPGVGSGIYYSAPISLRPSFLLRLEPNEVCTWHGILEMTAPVGIGTFDINTQGSLALYGSARDSVDISLADTALFYPFAPSNDNSGAFINKLKCVPSTDTIQITSCNELISPSGKYTYTSSGQYIDTVDAGGACYEVLTIDLTIIDVPTDIQEDAGIISQWPLDTTGNFTYQWLNCDNNHSVIIGEDSPSILNLGGGNYALEVTGLGCVDTSACSIQLGIEDVIIENHISIYPNPNSGTFTIEFDGVHGIGTIRIYDYLGKLHYVEECKARKTKLLNSALNKGIYFLEIESDGQKYVSRFIVN